MCLLMGGELPGRADADSHVEGHGERDRRGHLVADEGLDGRLLTGGDLKEEFVVNLDEEARGQAGLGQGVGDVHHGDLDNVCGTALDRGIEGGALGHLAALAVRGAQVGQVAASPEHRLGVAVGTRMPSCAARP